MSLRINLNSAAMNASRNLTNTDNNLGKAIERLSSGYKINRSSDDPAGLVISEKLRAQISGMTQAISNSQDAINLVKTAEGALTEVNSTLRSMRDLAVHAANVGANDPASAAADQAQIASAIKSLDNISARTAFGDQKLLDGTGGQTFSIAKPSQISSMSVGAGSGSAFSGKTGAVNLTATAATKTTLTGAVATYTAVGDAIKADDTVFINGTKIGDFTTSNKVSDVISAINDKSAQTGVVASFDTDHIVLTATTAGASQKIDLSETGASITAAGLTSGVAGANATVTGLSIGGDAVDTAAFVASTTDGNVLTNAAGDSITVASSASGVAATDVASSNGSALSFQIGAKAGETASISITSTATDQIGLGVATGKSVKTIDVTTAAGAQEAIKVLDQAIKDISGQRASMGAFQKNILESNMNSLGVAKENVSASESAIRDTDMATEMTNFTRLNIMEQAGTAMLTQANQLPQQLLSLLRG